MLVFESAEALAQLVVEHLKRLFVMQDPRFFVPHRVEIADVRAGQVSLTSRLRGIPAKSSLCCVWLADLSCLLAFRVLGDLERLYFAHDLKRIRVRKSTRPNVRHPSRQAKGAHLLDRVHQLALHPFFQFLNPSDMFLLLR